MRVYEGEYHLRGKEMRIRAEVAPPEHDVGIMGPYPVGVTLYDGDTPVDLTEDELNDIMQDSALLNSIDAWYYGGDN